MVATASSVTRDIDDSGDEIKSFADASAREVQGMALDPEIQGDLLTWFTTDASAVDSKLIVAGTPKLFKVDVILDATVVADRWLMIVDKATAAVNNDLPVLRARVAGGFASIDLGVWGLPLALGLAVCVSTTPADVQLPGGAGDGFYQGAYHVIV
jgi:hypothetical protein